MTIDPELAFTDKPLDLRRRARRASRSLGSILSLMSVVLTTMLCPVASSAVAPKESTQTASLGDLTLEELGGIMVTSVSRRSEPLADAPASIYVITHEAIRRSGAITLPEALRLAPNLDVARADANQYAISARGFSNVLANKLLVMIDGRTVYSPLFSGVFWEAQDLMLADIDRIEVISGPGATLWGANAVNGVINIITRPAGDTQGTLVDVGGGNRQDTAAVRYGGALGDSSRYRIYAKYLHVDHSERTDGAPIRDKSDHGQIGFRIDGNDAVANWTVQGDAYTASIDQLPSARDLTGANLLTRWTRAFADGSSVQIQAYYDRTTRDHPSQFHEVLDTLDVEFQHQLAPLANNRILYGAGYRFARDDTENSASQAFLPPERNLRWANVFVQDTIDLGAAFTITPGIKVETNIYTHAEVLPSIRFDWRATPEHVFWGALSRAVRAPARVDRDLFIPGQPPYALAGGAQFDSEVANVAELGWRARPMPGLTWSATVFHADYDRLRSLAPAIGGAVFRNGISGHETGIEAWGTWRVMPQWRLLAGIVALHERLHVNPGEIDLGGLTSLGNDPDAWGSVRSEWDFLPNWEFDLSLRRTAARPNPQVPSYSAVDARLAWRASPNLELSLSAQNLLDPSHTEWGSAANRAEFGRAMFVGLKWMM